MVTTTLQGLRALENREIMVLEPDDAKCEFLSRIFNRAGARVTMAANGSEAIQMARMGAFEVVVAARAIPDMDGLEFIRSVRGISPDTRTVLVVAGGDSDAAPESWAGAADAVVRRPFSVERVLDVVRAALTRMG